LPFVVLVKCLIADSCPLSSSFALHELPTSPAYLAWPGRKCEASEPCDDVSA